VSFFSFNKYKENHKRKRQEKKKKKKKEGGGRVTGFEITYNGQQLREGRTGEHGNASTFQKWRTVHDSI
jgi:hypothetical protein